MVMSKKLRNIIYVYDSRFARWCVSWGVISCGFITEYGLFRGAWGFHIQSPIFTLSSNADKGKVLPVMCHEGTEGE